MLGNLFKYEFKACSRILLPVYGSSIIMSLFASLVMLLLPENMSQISNAVVIIVGILATVVMMMFAVAMYASILVSIIYSVIRFKKSLLGSEGYVMNTLPVSAFSNVMAKMLCTFVYMLLSSVTVIICILLFAFIPSGVALPDLISGFGEFVKEFAQLGISAWSYVVFIVAMIVVSTFKSIAMMYAAMAVGHSFNKSKVLISFGIYILAGFVESIVSTILLVVILYAFSSESAQTVFNVLITVVTAVGLIFGAAYTTVATLFIKKRLNLE